MCSASENHYSIISIAVVVVLVTVAVTEKEARKGRDNIIFIGSSVIGIPLGTRYKYKLRVKHIESCLA